MDKDKDKDTGGIIYIDFNNLPRYKEQLLQLSREKQYAVLRLAYTKGIDVWFETTRIFLDASVRHGGIESGDIENLFEDIIMNEL
tara:strand:- start:685 stop:939 length:255 start_codon:yes stop_codon:yes gene_type:complete